MTGSQHRAAVLTQTERIFYDGECGLCDRGVRFVLSRDLGGKAFRFAPLQGDTFRKALAPGLIPALPDTMLVQTRDGRLLMRSEAWVHILDRLGGRWRLISALLRIIPRPIRDAAYDLVARLRHRLFRRLDGACPIGAPGERARFDP